MFASLLFGIAYIAGIKRVRESGAQGGGGGGTPEFFGFEIFNSGIFWVGNFDNYFFGSLDLSNDFLGYSEQCYSVVTMYPGCKHKHSVSTLNTLWGSYMQGPNQSPNLM